MPTINQLCNKILKLKNILVFYLYIFFNHKKFLLILKFLFTFILVYQTGDITFCGSGCSSPVANVDDDISFKSISSFISDSGSTKYPESSVSSMSSLSSGSAKSS
jgi:hypothetical protein